MAKLTQHHFYYGAILDALCQYNPDASPTLMSKGDEGRQIYRVMTNTSQESILFFKHASPRTDGKNQESLSFSFTFTDDDKQKLKALHEQNSCPIFLYLLCKQSELKYSEIAILNYNEYIDVEENRTVTIKVEKHKNNFILFRRCNKSRDNDLLIPRNRIEKTFDQLLDDKLKKITQKKNHTMNTMDSLFTGNTIYPNTTKCPICNNSLRTLRIKSKSCIIYARICSLCKRKYVNKKQYKIISNYFNNKPIQDLYVMDFLNNDDINQTIVNNNDIHENKQLLNQNRNDSENISYFSNGHIDRIYIIPNETNTCPIHKCKMDIKLISLGIKYKDTFYFCRTCNKYIVSRNHAITLEKLRKRNQNKFLQSIRFQDL